MPAEGHKTRRFFLAAGSTTAVFATLGAAAIAAPVDPIFAAIERHRVLRDAFSEAFGLPMRVRPTKKDENHRARRS